MIDLHSHSTASDGSLSPEDLLALAGEVGLQHLALTDHDTIAGLEAATAAANRHGINLIPGVELSVSWQKRTLHIVGLNIDPDCPKLLSILRTAADTRINRARAIGASLENAGIRGAFDGARDIAGDDSNLSRSHFARFLVAQGHARNSQQVFKRFMVGGKPGYVAAEWIALADAVNVIHAAGGVAVLAHPSRYRVTAGKLRRIIADFRCAGGDAMEVCCGGSNPGEVSHLARLARENQLCASLGSDFHGPDKPWAKLGHLAPIPTGIASVLDRIVSV